MTQSEHRAPLAPGEIRTHTVGDRTFKVMHVAGGSFTQMSVRLADGCVEHIATERFEQQAVNAYADAIEQAEADMALPANVLTADGVPEVEQATSTDLPCLAMVGDKRYSGGLRAAKGHAHLLATGPECNDAWPVPDLLTPAERAFVTELQTDPAPAPTLADDVAALRTEVEAYFPDGNAPKDIATILDRIEASVPQRATCLGAPMVIHTCGYARSTNTRSACRWCGKVGTWRALYVLPDGA
jgi:hypothetical protein